MGHMIFHEINISLITDKKLFLKNQIILCPV